MSYRATAVVESDVSKALKGIRQVKAAMLDLAHVPTDYTFTSNTRASVASTKRTQNEIAREVERGTRQQIDIAARMEREGLRSSEAMRRSMATTALREEGANARAIAAEKERTARAASASIERAAVESAKAIGRTQREQAREAGRLARQAAKEQESALLSFEREQKASLARQVREAETSSAAQSRAAEKAAKDTARAATKASKTTAIKRNDARGELSDKVSDGATIAGASVLVGIGASLKVLEDYDRELRNVNSIAQLSEPNLQKLSDSIRSISLDPQVRKGPQDLAAGLYDIYSVGFKGAQALDILRAAAKGAAAGGSDTATAVGVLTGTLNAQIKGATNARQVMDSLFQTVNDGRVTFPQLANAMGQTLPFLKSGGVTLQEYGAYMALATKQSQKAEFATNNLNNLISKLGAPSKEAQKEFEKLGIKFGFAETNAVGFTAKMAEIAQKTKGSSDALHKLFPDMQAFMAVQTAVSGKMAGFNSMAANQAKAVRGIGATAVAASKQNQGLGYTVDKANVNLQNFALTVSSTVVPVVTELMQKGDLLYRQFRSLPLATQQTTIKYAAYAAIALVVIGRIKAAVEFIALLRQAQLLQSTQQVIQLGKQVVAWTALRASQIAQGAVALYQMAAQSAAVTALTTRIGILRAASITSFAGIGIAIAALVAIVWGVRTAIVGFGDASSMTADKLIEKWGVLGQVWVKAGDFFGNLMSKINGSAGRGDTATDKLLAAENKRRQKAGLPAVSREQFQGDANADEKLPSYDVGTSYVPNDQIAQVHRGEIIIPAKYADQIRKAARGPQFAPAAFAPHSNLMPASRGGLPTLAPMPIAALSSPLSSAASYQAQQDSIEAQIRALEDKMDARRIDRAEKKLKGVDVQMKRYAELVRHLRERKSDLAKLETAARGREKTFDVRIGGVVKNSTLRDMLDAPNNPDVARIMAQQAKDGLSLPKTRDKAHGNAWRAADYVGSNNFKRDLTRARIDEGDADRVKSRIMAEATYRDQIKQTTSAATAAADADKRRTKIIGEATADIAQQNAESEKAAQLLRDQQTWLAAHPGDEKGAQDFADINAQKKWLWRDQESPVVKLYNAGAVHEANEAFKTLFGNYVAAKDAATHLDNFNNEQAAFAEIARQNLETDTDAKAATSELSAALADTRTSADDLEKTLDNLPDSVKHLGNTGDAAAAQWKGLVELMDAAKKRVPYLRDLESLGGALNPLADSANSTRDSVEGQLRDLREANLTDYQKLQLRKNDALAEFNRQIPNVQITTPEGAAALSKQYDDLVAKWDAILADARAVEDLQAQSNDASAVDTTSDTTSTGRGFDFTTGIQQQGQELNGLLDSIRRPFDDCFAGIKTNGISSFRSMFDGILDGLADFSTQFLANKIWNTLLGAFLPSIGGSAKGLGSAVGSGFPQIGPPKIDGSFASGLDYVPRDGFIGELHRGEAVLTASDAADWRKGANSEFALETARSGNSGDVYVTNNYSIGKVEAKNPHEFTGKMPGQRVSTAQMKAQLNKAASDGNRYR